MAVSYPDVIGDYINAKERFASGGLQYTGYFEPVSIVPGDLSSLLLFVQNTLNVPLKIQIKVEVPKSGGFLRNKNPMLAIAQPEFEIELQAAEVGILSLPVSTTKHVETGDYTLSLEVKTTPKGHGSRIRPTKSTSALDNALIDNPTGLNLVSSLGATYIEKPVKKAPFTLNVSGKPKTIRETSSPRHNYETIWVQDSFKHYNQAIQELNLRQVKLRNDLNIEQLYVNLYAEATRRFADVGMPLRIGEAITMAKILTYSCQYFLTNPDRRNGLLVPIWEHALAMEANTTDALDVIRTYGFHHITRLAVAMSFGIIAKTVGQQLWSVDERKAVGNHIADKVEVGDPLDVEFLYLPLLMAGTQICDKVKMQGEDVNHTLALMKTARDARIGLFKDEDMVKADKIYDQILAKLVKE